MGVRPGLTGELAGWRRRQVAVSAQRRGELVALAEDPVTPKRLSASSTTAVTR
jgi:hypothetical protein